MDTLHDKVITQNWRREKEFLRQAKQKEFISTKPALQRNVKGSSLSENEKAIIRNKKIYEGKKKLTGKGKYIVNALDQSLKS